MTNIYRKRICNIYDDTNGKKDSSIKIDDTISISRTNMEENEHIAKTESGKIIEISRRWGTVLEHGDVLQCGPPEKKNLLVKQTEEKVILAKFLDWDPTDNYDLYANLTYDTPMQVGHIIGEMHKPMSIRANGEAVSFPIDDDSEFEEFGEKLYDVSGDVEAEITKEVFVEGVIDEGYYEQ